MTTDTNALSEMKVKALAGWAGGKRNLAPRYIVPLLGPHNAYWDIFAGSMAVVLVKPVSRVEVVNDLHGDITNLGRIIQDPILGSKLYRRLRRVLFDQTLHREAQEALRDEMDPFERAFLYFIKVWQGWGGSAGTKRAGRTMSVRYTNNGGHQAMRFHSAVASIPAWRRRLRNVSILNTDGFKLLDNIEDAPGTVIYVDPPYLENDVSYEHDFLPLDHVRLAQALHRFRASRIVISYYEQSALDDLYPDWQVHRIPVTKALCQAYKRGGGYRQKAVEVLLVNESASKAANLPLFYNPENHQSSIIDHQSLKGFTYESTDVTDSGVPAGDHAGGRVRNDESGADRCGTAGGPGGPGAAGPTDG